LARTNWDVPKHRGLSVFMLKINQPGIEVHRIEMLNGSKEFCQEFMTDVVVPHSQLIGQVDEGWGVVVRWMFHERTIAGGSKYVTSPAGRPAVALDPTGGPSALIPMAKKRGILGENRVKEMIGESLAITIVGNALTNRITEEVRAGSVSDQAAAITRLWYGVTAVRNSTICFELPGATAVAWSDDEIEFGKIGQRYLMRQASCIAGGTTEMARNAISERVLGMPSERRVDKDIPFRDVPRSAASR
jgi:alkylation response protein AidB-like acyl-CoA dehydrogenase